MLAAQRFSTTALPRPVNTRPSRPWERLTLRSEPTHPVEAKALNLLWNSTPVVVQLLSMRSKKAAYITGPGRSFRTSSCPQTLGNPRSSKPWQRYTTSWPI